MEHIASIANQVGGGGDRQNVIRLMTGHVIFIAYGTIGVYSAAAFETLESSGSGEPLATWPYPDTGAQLGSDGSEPDTEVFFHVQNVRTEYLRMPEGASEAVDVVLLRAVQEIYAPSVVCLTITGQAVTYRAMDDYALPYGSHACSPRVHDPRCPLAPFGEASLV